MYRILIVDDDAIMRKALGVMISKVDGFEVCGEATNGRDAILRFKEIHPDIIFMDNVMPVMTGLEAIRSIRKTDNSVTIYILSAYINFNLAQEAMKLEVKEYLLKPIPLKSLMTVLVDYKTARDTTINLSMHLMEEIIEDRYFGKAYYNYEEQVREIYQKYGDDGEKLVDVFRYFGQHMISMIGGMEGQVKNLDDLLSLNENVIMGVQVGQMWLFKVMDYVFKQRSIRRYPVLTNVFQYIDEHIREEIGLNQIIENCAISQGYLSRIFKDQFKISVMEYLHMRKLYLAKCYMFLTNDSVAEIADRLGYNESSYFSKVFKKYEHMTVQQYRKTILSSNETEVR